MSRMVIKGGLLVDGSGSEPVRADIAVDGDIISAVGGLLDSTGRTIIDAYGLLVAPGFIDLHTHTDRTIFQTPMGDSKVLQGVTTDVTCNCGIGPFPVKRERQAELAAYLDTLAGSLPPEGITWIDFEGFAARVEKAGPGINLAPLVAHGTLRIAAMGSEDRLPSAAEMADMKKLLDQSLKQGAWGMSTGLIYPPGSFAQTAELIELAAILSRYGALYTSHVRGESAHLLEAVDEAIEIARQTRARILVSHLKAIGKPNWGKGLEALTRIEAARAQGIAVWADQYPYEATATALSALLPGWVHDGGVEALVARVQDASFKGQILAAITREMDTRGGPECVKIASVKTARNQCWVGKTIAEIAASRTVEPAAAVMDLLKEEKAAVNAIYFSLGREDLEGIIVSPDVAVGSDGQVMNAVSDRQQSVHPRSYGTFPRVLGRYVRELKLLPVETAIRKMTGLPASILEIPDRGLIRPGYKADIAIFDLQTVNDRADFANPHQYPEGIIHVLVNGTIAVKDSRLTGDGKGGVLRKQ